MPALSTHYEEHQIDSPFLGETLSAQIYLPPNYSPLYTYPLLIVQDGQDYFNLGRLGSVLDEMINQGRIEKVVACGIPYPNIKKRWSRYHPSGHEHTAYLHFLHRELLPDLQKTYSVEILSSGVTLLGSSLGGTVSLLSALNYPNTFGNVIMQSPFINDELIDLCGQKLSSTIRLYHSIGKNETNVKTTFGELENFYNPNKKLEQILQNKSISAYLFEENEGNHSWNYWKDDLIKALLMVYKIQK